MINRCTISPFQLFSITCFSLLLGLNLYPSALNHEITRQWLIAQIITIIIIIPIVLMILKISENTKADSLQDILQRLFGGFFSRIIGFIFCFYFLLQSYKLLFLESNKIQLFLFDKTPVFIIAAIILIVSFVITVQGISSAAKLSEILIISAAAVIFISLFIYFKSSDTNEMRTLFTLEANGMIGQVIRSVSCFSGIELSLFFICKTLNTNARKKAVLSGFAVCSIIIISITLCITGVFTINAAAGMHYPVTELARTVQLNYMRIVERFDAITIPISISAICIYISFSMYSSAESLSILLFPIKFRYTIVIYSFMILFVIFLFQEKYVIFLSKYILYIEMFILFIIIPCMYFLSVKEKNDAI